MTSWPTGRCALFWAALRSSKSRREIGTCRGLLRVDLGWSHAWEPQELTPGTPKKHHQSISKTYQKPWCSKKTAVMIIYLVCHIFTNPHPFVSSASFGHKIVAWRRSTLTKCCDCFVVRHATVVGGKWNDIPNSQAVMIFSCPYDEIWCLAIAIAVLIDSPKFCTEEVAILTPPNNGQSPFFSSPSNVNWKWNPPHNCHHLTMSQNGTLCSPTRYVYNRLLNVSYVHIYPIKFHWIPLWIP